MSPGVDQQHPPKLVGGRRVPGQDSHAEAVYAATKRDILSSTLAPGTPLREEALARAHGVSRTPVREALTRLEREGLLWRRSRTGLVVSEVSQDRLIDLYVLREALEGLVGRLVTERRTEFDLTRFELTVESASRALSEGDMKRALKLGSEFHHLLRQVAGNQPLARALSDVLEQVQRSATPLDSRARAEQSHAEHVQLLEAIRARDVDAAERLAATHVRQILKLRIAISIEDGARSQHAVAAD